MAERSEAAILLLTLVFIAGSGLYALAGRAPSASFSVRTERKPAAAQVEAVLPTASDTGDDQTDKALVDLNAAGAETLMTLPGVSEALALKIVDFRDQYGPFSQPDELYLIDGVDTALFEAIRARVFCGIP